MENKNMKNNRHKLDASYLNLANLDNARFLDNENETLKQYLREVRKFKPISNEEEIEMIKNYQRKGPGYEKDLEQVIGYNQRFVIMVVKRYCPLNVDICDLIGEANIGMLEAIDKFDTGFGTKFITYAGRLIIKYVFEYLENLGFIKQPNRSKIHGTIDKITEELFNKNGYYPTLDEIEEEFAKRGVVVKDKSDFMKISIESVDAPISDDDDDIKQYGEEDNIEERANNEVIKENIKKVLETLPEIERTIVIKTFGFDGSDEQNVSTIAFTMGISEYKVKTYLEDALNKFRKYKVMFE